MRGARWAGRVVVVLLALVLAACTSPPERPRADPDVTGSVPRPLNVQDPAPVPTAPPPTDCKPRESLRPRGARPAPRQMPVGSTMARIAGRGRLLVGIDQNAFLFGYRNPETGELKGFEIDIAREVATAIFGNPNAVQFRAITTADRIPVLQRHEVDMVVRTMTMTCERWRQVSFSTEYLTSHQRLLVNKGSRIRSFDDLAGKKVCATRGSTSLRAIAAARSHPVPVTTDSTLDCLVMLQQGQVAAVSTIDVLLAGLSAQDPGTEIVGPLLSDEPSGIGIPRDQPDFVRFVNAVLAETRSSGRWQRYYADSLSSLGGIPAPPVARYRD